LFSKFFILLFIFINFLPNLYANEKKLIINRLINIHNITFNFEQITNEKKEIGICILVFDNKLKCKYKDSMQKEVLINGKTLVVSQKRYNKNYFYPIANTMFVNILNKKKLINLIEKSSYKIKKNIELSYVDENNKRIITFFEKENYNLIGWKVSDQLQNNIFFSLKIISINNEHDPIIFKIPLIN
jgi:outer membrane lipoprotein-sorting protein|tara:strand:- start:727 stop:1284 length:558 start_codon:yes stop_codon:yes gene_type:complete